MRRLIVLYLSYNGLIKSFSSFVLCKQYITILTSNQGTAKCHHVILFSLTRSYLLVYLINKHTTPIKKYHNFNECLCQGLDISRHTICSTGEGRYRKQKGYTNEDLYNSPNNKLYQQYQIKEYKVGILTGRPCIPSKYNKAFWTASFSSWTWSLFISCKQPNINKNITMNIEVKSYINAKVIV